MEGSVLIRRERAEDRSRVEELTRAAFYNVYVPGCNEHYLVHIMREHPDFIPQLALVAERAGEVIGNIMYTKAWLTAETGEEKEILTFGPVSVDPAHQRRGYGRALIGESLRRGAELGYEAVVIFGDPGNYVGLGFQSCKKLNIAAPDGSFPAAMLGLELVPGALAGRRWTYRGSPVMELDMAAAQAYDDGLPPMERKVLPSQETFYILSHAVLP